MVIYSKIYVNFLILINTSYKLNFSQFDFDPIYLGLNQIINI